MPTNTRIGFPYAYQDEFKPAQAEAMGNQLGLWSPTTRGRQGRGSENLTMTSLGPR